MSELIALVSTTVSITLQIKSWVEQITYNQETRLLLVDRITSALTQLQTESRKISRSSPDLIRSVQKLKNNLQRVLEQCQKPKTRANVLVTRLREWIDKDTVSSALQAVETQISYCFQEFGALGAVRIERKLGDHNVQINRKLDELLRRNPPGANRPASVAIGRNAARPVAILTRASASGSSENAPTSPGLPNSPSTKALTFSLPAPARTKSYTSTSTASLSDRNLIRPDAASPPVAVIRNTPKEAVSPSVSRSEYFVPPVKSDTSVSSSRISATGNDRTDGDSLSTFQADKLDSECKRLRSLKHLSEAVIAGRKAAALRRIVYATDKSHKSVAALARSLTYLARCLKDIHVDSHLTGARVSVELTAVLSESVELYKVAFKEHKGCRIDLATALYNLSVRQSEPVQTRGPLNRPSWRSNNLTTALTTAEEAIHHFTVLEREDPDAYGLDLAHALLNLSFILSDVGKHEKALTISRKAVMLAYRFTSTDPHTQERARNIRTLNKALMRVSFCLANLGRAGEAQEAEMEANDVLKKPFFTS